MEGAGNASIFIVVLCPTFFNAIFAEKDMSDWIKMRLVGLDTETTGLSPQEDRIFEIALVTFENGKLVDKWEVMMNPQKPLSEESLNKTGVTNEELQDKMVFSYYADEIAHRIEGQILVGYNIIGFDMPFLRAEMKRIGREVPSCTVVDPLVFARGLFKDGRHSLSDILERLGLTTEKAHRASYDAESAVRVLLAMAPSLPADLDELLKLQSQWLEKMILEKKNQWKRKDKGGLTSEPLDLLRDEALDTSLGPAYLYQTTDIDPLRFFLRSYFTSRTSKG
jgi:DNA polymerase-3 subunit epsilon